MGLSQDSQTIIQPSSWPTFLTEELSGPLPPRRDATLYHRDGRDKTSTRALGRLTRRHRHQWQMLFIASDLSSKMEILRPLDLVDVLSNRSPYLQDPFAHLEAGIKILYRLLGSLESRKARIGPSLAGKKPALRLLAALRA